MTLVEVINAARDILNEPVDVLSRTAYDDTSSFWTDTQLVTYHNLIQQEVQGEIIQSFEDYFVTQTTVDVVNGTAEYTLPTDFVKMRRVEDLEDASEPQEIRPSRMNKTYYFGPNVAISGVDQYGGYFIRGNQIVFDRTPTANVNSGIRLFYVKRLSDVTDLSSTSEIPKEHHRALVWGIAKLALYQQQSDNNFAVREYEKHLNRARGHSENRQVQRPRHVVRRKFRRR